MRRVTWTHAARTDIGRVRDHNEDAWLAVPERGLFAVADGLGGHAAGEVASATAVRALADRFRRLPETAGREQARAAMREAIEEANRAIRDAARADRAREGMGTTVTALFLDSEGEWLIGHVGDSRAYLARDARVRRLTRDHTVVQDMVERGRLTDEQARVHPRSNILTRALGIEPEAAAELYEGTARPGDRFLLATDGLTGMLPQEELERALLGPAEPEPLVEELVGAANRAGGRDNITALAVSVAEAG